MALSGWGKRIEITIPAASIDGNLTNFPVLLMLSTSSGTGNDDVSAVFDELQSDANRKKIAVGTAGDVECYVEIQSWNDASELAYLWVNVPSVDSSDDTLIYLYYDADHAENTDYVGDTGDAVAENVWSNFTSVYHLEEQGSGVADEIINSADVTNSGQSLASGTTDAELVSGPIENGLKFGSAVEGEYIAAGGTANAGTEVTLECMFNIGTSVNAVKGLVMNPSGSSTGQVLLYQSWGNLVGFVRCAGGNATMTGTTVLSIDTVYYAAVRYKSTEIPSTWLNGAQEKAHSGALTGVLAAPAVFDIGNWHLVGSYEAIDSIVDEVRVSSVKRADEWLKATNLSNRDNLVSYGVEEALSQPGPGKSRWSNDNPWSGSIDGWSGSKWS